MDIPYSQHLRRWRRQLDLFWLTRTALFSMLAIGFILRVDQYLSNRALWLDEARLSLNIVNRSFGQLLDPLDHNQGAPVGFLFVTKLVVTIFGNHEYSLRLLPFLAGIVSLFLFYKIGPYYLSSTTTFAVALGLFSLSEELAYYSAEVKQYSSDVTLALLLYGVTLYLKSRELTIPRLLLFGGVGAAALWFSHPALFILAGIGSGLTLFALLKREWNRIYLFLIAYLLWGISFIILYFVSLRELSHYQALQNYWASSFMPLPPASTDDLSWFITHFFSLFRNPGGATLEGLAAFSFLLGSLAMLRKEPERFWLLISPLLFALFASGFQYYPFSGRLLLFAVPALLMLMAEGIGYLREKTGNSAPIFSILVGLLFLHPSLIALSDLTHPEIKDEIRLALDYVQAHWQEGDVLYVYYGAEDAFNYYRGRYDFGQSDYIIGLASREKWQAYADDLVQLQGRPRVWILFSHIYEGDVNEEKLFLYQLDQMGLKLDSYRVPGRVRSVKLRESNQADDAAAYLYDLSRP